MVEEHVGKKRRKEVRQAILISEQMHRNIITIVVIFVIGCVLVFGLGFLSYTGLVPISPAISHTVPLVVLFLAMIVVAPKANKFWALREQFKDHCRRYNISKEDMRALKSGEL